MVSKMLFYTLYMWLLFFGVVLSTAFCGITIHRKNYKPVVLLYISVAILQALSYLLLGEDITWKIYPFIVHFPIGIALHVIYNFHPYTIISAITTTYLCCQPANLVGLCVQAVTGNITFEYIARIITLACTLYIMLKYFKNIVSQISTRASLTTVESFAIPLIYYAYDYVTTVYSEALYTQVEIVSEILPCLMFFFYFLVSLVYKRRFQEIDELTQTQKITSIVLDQQSKEIERVRNANHEVRLLRHDMRHTLNNLAFLLDQNDIENAKKLISGYRTQIDETSISRYCLNEMLNYVLVNYELKCRQNNIDCVIDVKIEGVLIPDELLLLNIISNGMDNAINAQMELDKKERRISFYLRQTNDKFLLHIQNPYASEPFFIDGLPVSQKEGHGYGTQSIIHLTKQLGGTCDFLAQDGIFSMRMIL